MLCFAGAVQSQISVHLTIGDPPQWGPTGYSDVRYYYLPDVEAYYDVHSSMFIYFNGISWVRRSSLPSKYRNYDLYNGYKVVMSDYHGNTPYSHFKEHRMKYAKGYRGTPQKNFGERPDRKNDNENQRNVKKSGSKKNNRKTHDREPGNHRNN